MTEEKSELWSFLASLAERRRPMQTIIATATRMPMRMPGKKPARKMGAGKGLFLAEAGVGVVAGALVGVLVGLGVLGWDATVEEGVEEELVGVELEETVFDDDELVVLVKLRMGKVVVGRAELEVLIPEVDAAEADAAALEPAAVGGFIMHCALLSHAKPCGQQSLPHFTKGPPKSML